VGVMCGLFVVFFLFKNNSHSLTLTRRYTHGTRYALHAVGWGAGGGAAPLFSSLLETEPLCVVAA